RAARVRADAQRGDARGRHLRDGDPGAGAVLLRAAGGGLMHAKTRNVQWVGGPQDGGWVTIPYEATWVSVLEDRRNPGYVPEPDGSKPPRSLQRYTVPVID